MGGGRAPCAILTPHGDGPVVGRFGGPLLLPAGLPGPPARTYLVATLDLAALPEAATGLPLPGRRAPAPDRPLLRGSPGRGRRGPSRARGHPGGETPLAPGHDPDDAWAELGGRTAEGEVLRLRRDVSLPGNESLYDPAEYPSARELRYAWAQGRDEAHPHHDGLRLQLGGYPVDPYGETDMLTASARQAARVSGQPVEEQSGPWEAPRAGKQVLLAQWYGGALVDGRVYWTAARRDLAAGRSGAVSVLGFFQGPG
ncbi:hypothetical protein GCM10010295_00230 [Streptomyces intermedius]